MPDIYVKVFPQPAFDVVIQPSNVFDVVTSKYDISTAVTENEVLSLISGSPVGDLTIQGADAVTVTSSGNHFTISAPLSTGAVQTGSLTGVFYPLTGIVNVQTPLTSGVNQQQISYGRTLSTKPHNITSTICNDIDNLIYSFVISSVTTSGFYINFSDYLGSTGYVLNSTIVI